ncbi:hypothetical protein M23134_06619 [Microscilla marina ATCC 23134]|uniref:Uncharacterized protein n=1 Tax=Microscilla marina ATCC 23134 TaxID=313606 RepID=A2A088_MICM2|nr:hypothetical protein M23134_06619 [Microscilla marina ATCC 23134]
MYEYTSFRGFLGKSTRHTDKKYTKGFVYIKLSCTFGL